MRSRSYDNSAAVLILLTGAAMLAYHGFVWLQTGDWQPWTMLTVVCLSQGPALQMWCAWPDSWQGLHTLLGWVPIWLVVILLALSGLLDDR